MTDSEPVTHLLREVSRGNRQALEQVYPIVYDTLRRLAQRALRGERQGHTLSATALAHEAYLDLVGLDRIDWQDRAHFFAVAARAMRRILVDHAVARNALKRGGGAARVDLDDVVLPHEEPIADVIAVDHALERLAALDPRPVRVVECRVFMGMSISETAG